VECLRPDSPTQVTVGLRLVWGLGTALGRAGEPFYIVLQGNAPSGGSDVVDNGGFAFRPGAPDCSAVMGEPSGPFSSGAVIITRSP
jgi:hypothetical protein